MFSTSNECEVYSVTCKASMYVLYSFVVFGVDLTTLVKAHNTKLPTIVEDCVREVEQRGIMFFSPSFPLLHFRYFAVATQLHYVYKLSKKKQAHILANCMVFPST